MPSAVVSGSSSCACASGPWPRARPQRPPLRVLDGVRRRRDEHLAERAVDDHRRARRHPGRRVVQADDGRDLQRPGENRRVIRAAAGIHGKPLDARPIELRRERRGELVGDENGGSVELTQQVARPARPVPQVHPQPAGDVRDVGFAFAQVGVFDAREDVADLLVGAVHRPRRVHPLFFDDLLRPSDEQGIVQHEDLGVEMAARSWPGP